MSEADPPGSERRYYGKYPGIVVDNAAPDGGAHRGEVKVRVPGILEESPGTKDSRPLEAMAAPSFLPGFFLIPAKDDNVWVEFVAGDINFPIWTGVWYARDKTPLNIEGKPAAAGELIIRAGETIIQLSERGVVIQTRGDIELLGKEKLIAREDDVVDCGTLVVAGTAAAVTATYTPPPGDDSQPQTNTITLTGKIKQGKTKVKAG